MNNGFKGFPKKLHGKPVGITNLRPGWMAAGQNRPPEVYYTIKDGDWSDPTIWETTSGRPVALGLPSDSLGTPGIVTTSPTSNMTAYYAAVSKSPDVYIRHNVNFTFAGNTEIAVRNLFISPEAKLTHTGASNLNRYLSVLGNVQCLGTWDFSNTFGGDVVWFFGVNNRVDNSVFKTGSTAITIRYASYEGQQPILNLPYANLTIINGGQYGIVTSWLGGSSVNCKYLTSDLTITGNLVISNPGSVTQPIVELGSYNLTVTGTTVMDDCSFIRTAHSGYTLFIGQCFVRNFTRWYFPGGADVEFRGGFSFGTVGGSHDMGTGTYKFTTNNQTFSLSSSLNFQNIKVEGAITVTYTAASAICQINGELTGTEAGSTWINNGRLYFNNSSTYSYATGVFDRTTTHPTSAQNIVGYIFNGTVTLPYTDYCGLYISGTGVKSPAADLPLGGSLQISTTGTFDVTTYNLTVGLGTVIEGKLLKTGSGSVLFVGSVNANFLNAQLNFGTGNPTVEMRGGFTTFYTANALVPGTAAWSFTTNNQAIQHYGATWVGNISIVGDIVVTLNSPSNASPMRVAYMNGTTAGSTFRMGSGGSNNCRLYFTTNATSMTTGFLDCVTNPNQIGYEFTGDYTLPRSDYRGLYIDGNGVKTAVGNLSMDVLYVKGFVNSGDPCTLELGNYNLTTTGVAEVGGYSTGTAAPCVHGVLSKTGAGTILIGGQFRIAGGKGTLSLTGNPSVELRGGLHLATNFEMLFAGTPTFTFTTNNQNITCGGTYIFPLDVMISGAITITQSIGGTNFSGTINGNNALSTLDNRATLQFSNAVAPMSTGVLQTNAAANTTAYNRADNQDVKGGTYRTLQFTNGGIKKLLGNVVVNQTGGGSLTIASGTTIDYNGFTITTI